jgi:hypothetical protein
MPSYKDDKNSYIPYSELLDNLKVAEELEWQSTELFNKVNHRKAISLYIKMIIPFLLISIIPFFMKDISFKGILEIDQIFRSNFLLIVIPISAIITSIILITERENRALFQIENDAKFRLKLALELISPMRDLLYILAENNNFSESQISSLRSRLSRFPMDERKQSGTWNYG